mmetsp:Transcript_58672/g.191343  ORF Transcript_58672/g.191343 Transcript_58672/m.191343 type:complete len:247 (+) Transcript_58672:133-873(+)
MAPIHFLVFLPLVLGAASEVASECADGACSFGTDVDGEELMLLQSRGAKGSEKLVADSFLGADWALYIVSNGQDGLRCLSASTAAYKEVSFRLCDPESSSQWAVTNAVRCTVKVMGTDQCLTRPPSGEVTVQTCSGNHNQAWDWDESRGMFRAVGPVQSIQNSGACDCSWLPKDDCKSQSGCASACRKLNPGVSTCAVDAQCFTSRGLAPCDTTANRLDLAPPSELSCNKPSGERYYSCHYLRIRH